MCICVNTWAFQTPFIQHYTVLVKKVILASAEFVPSTKEESTYGWLYFSLLFFMEDVQLP